MLLPSNASMSFLEDVPPPAGVAVANSPDVAPAVVVMGAAVPDAPAPVVRAAVPEAGMLVVRAAEPEAGGLVPVVEGGTATLEPDESVVELCAEPEVVGTTVEPEAALAAAATAVEPGGAAVAVAAFELLLVEARGGGVLSTSITLSLWAGDFDLRFLFFFSTTARSGPV